MHADSGLYVFSDERKVTRELLPPELIYPFKESPGDGEEIIYWRKNYGLCQTILNYCQENLTPNEKGKYIIKTKEQIYSILEIIVHFMNEKIWINDANSMWSYGEVLSYLRKNMNNLCVMMNFMKDNPDIYLVFYY